MLPISSLVFAFLRNCNQILPVDPLGLNDPVTIYLFDSEKQDLLCTANFSIPVVT
jgi:hypothetical protein